VRWLDSAFCPLRASCEEKQSHQNSHLNGSAGGESGVKPPQSKILLFA